MRIELADALSAAGVTSNAVGQISIPQFPHEIPERNGPFLFRLFQGGPGVFEVATVHFLLGQALSRRRRIRWGPGPPMPRASLSANSWCTCYMYALYVSDVHYR